MNLKKYTLAAFGMTSFFIAGCDGENIEGTQSAVNEIDQIQEDIITELNGLHQEETALQAAFDESLAADDTMKTFADGSAPVFQNIDSRRERLESLNNLTEQFDSQEEVLQGYEGETLSQEQLEELSSQVDTFSSDIQGFTESYEQTLTTQEEYFTSIGAEDATYETFSEGIIEVNDQKAGMQETLVSLDDSLETIDTSISEAQSMIENALSENE